MLHIFIKILLESKLKGLNPQTEREKIVQELNDTKQEIEKLNTRKNELSETQEIAKLKRKLETESGVKLLISNNVTNEQKRQVLNDVAKNIASIKAQGIEYIAIAHGEGSLADGTWRMDGNKANLETVGKHFADKHGKVLVVACENHLVRTGDGTNGYVFEKGKSQPSELNLSDKVENKNGVELHTSSTGSTPVFHLDRKKFVKKDNRGNFTGEVKNVYKVRGWGETEVALTKSVNDFINDKKTIKVENVDVTAKGSTIPEYGTGYYQGYNNYVVLKANGEILGISDRSNPKFETDDRFKEALIKNGISP